MGEIADVIKKISTNYRSQNILDSHRHYTVIIFPDPPHFSTHIVMANKASCDESLIITPRRHFVQVVVDQPELFINTSYIGFLPSVHLHSCIFSFGIHVCRRSRKNLMNCTMISRFYRQTLEKRILPASDV